MRESIAALVDYRLAPGLDPGDASEHGVLLLCMKGRTVVIGVTGPQTMERARGRLLWFVDYLNFTTRAEAIEMVELEATELKEILDEAATRRRSMLS